MGDHPFAAALCLYGEYVHKKKAIFFCRRPAECFRDMQKWLYILRKNTRIVIYNGYIAEYNGTPLKNYKSKLISIPIAATLCLVVYFISDKNKLAVMFCNMIFFTTILNALEIVFTDKGYSDGQIVILGFVACWMTVICCFLCT